MKVKQEHLKSVEKISGLKYNNIYVLSREHILCVMYSRNMHGRKIEQDL